MNERFMEEAVNLARGGFPAPNPHVGCVLVNNGQIVGRGFHDHAGGPHAEVVALSEAGSFAVGSDAYVTLEPCNHFGRTPPCSLALIRAGVRRVFVANSDPNPAATGGAATLREAGVEVQMGILADAAFAVNRQFLDSIRLQRPIVVIKAAISLDGRLALENGESKWITGPESRAAAHRLRAECGAVLVGYRTVLQDDPELTARIDGVVNQPVRIVLDPNSALTGRERVFNSAAPTIHLTGRPVDLSQILSDLFTRGIRGLLVEGGAKTIAHFLEAQLADRLELFVAPKILGEGITWTNGLQVPDLASALRVRNSSIQQVGSDLRIQAEFLRKL